MKTNFNILKHIPLTALLLALSLSSCTMEKRLYSSGYHIEWKNKHRPSSSTLTESKSSTKNLTTDSMYSACIESIVSPGTQRLQPDETITASTDKWAAISKKKTSSQKTMPDRRLSTNKKAKQARFKKSHLETEKTVQPEDTLRKQKNLLSTLWIFATLNYLYCDLVGLMDAAKLSQYLVGTVDGLVMSQGFLLGAAILIEIPMIMILLSRVLKGKGNRNANIIAGIIMTVVQLATLFVGPVSIYYLFFSIIEIATTAFIVWYAWKKFPKKAKV